jgi:hypothetical protein
MTLPAAGPPANLGPPSYCEGDRGSWVTAWPWVGKATLTGAAQLSYYVSGGNTIVRASTDADAAAELEIQLTGKKTLTVSDLVP